MQTTPWCLTLLQVVSRTVSSPTIHRRFCSTPSLCVGALRLSHNPGKCKKDLLQRSPSREKRRWASNVYTPRREVDSLPHKSACDRPGHGRFPSKLEFTTSAPFPQGPYCQLHPKFLRIKVGPSPAEDVRGSKGPHDSGRRPTV